LVLLNCYKYWWICFYKQLNHLQVMQTTLTIVMHHCAVKKRLSVPFFFFAADVRLVITP
jgi:hypothetical protein